MSEPQKLPASTRREVTAGLRRIAGGSVPNGKVVVDREALARLVDGVQAHWEDHSFACTSDNTEWVADKKAIRVAKRALGHQVRR